MYPVRREQRQKCKRVVKEAHGLMTRLQLEPRPHHLKNVMVVSIATASKIEALESIERVGYGTFYPAAAFIADMMRRGHMRWVAGTKTVATWSTVVIENFYMMDWERIQKSRPIDRKAHLVTLGASKLQDHAA